MTWVSHGVQATIPTGAAPAAVVSWWLNAYHDLDCTFEILILLLVSNMLSFLSFQVNKCPTKLRSGDIVPWLLLLHNPKASCFSGRQF